MLITLCGQKFIGQTQLTTCLLFDFQDDKHVRMIALGIGNYRQFMDQLREIAGDNVYTADNFDELSDLFNEILVESCSKYSLSEIARVIHFITTRKSEIRTDTLYHNNDNARPRFGPCPREPQEVWEREQRDS